MSRSQDGLVALNFFPLKTQHFEFEVYRRPVLEGEEFEGLRQRKLPDSDGEYEKYWVSHTARDGFDAFTCNQRTNNDLTRLHLGHLLERTCAERLGDREWDAERDRFRADTLYRALFVLEEHPEGRKVVWFRPYFLKSDRLWGYLADYKFDQADGIDTSRRTLELSLSLKRGRQNLDFYADRYDMLGQFTERYLRQITPLGDGSIHIAEKLHHLQAQNLSPREYVFGRNRRGRSQFQGVKQNGPLEGPETGAELVFVYREQDKPLSHDLYRALRGDTFGTFPGMEKMFGMRTDSSVVSGVAIEDHSVEEISRVCDLIKERSDGPAVPIVIVPFDRTGGEAADGAYHRVKHTFLKAGLPSQFVSKDLLRDPNQLKWSVSNIGLATFAKLGGRPWKVTPATDRCLIIGLGQAHRMVEGAIQKYFAYSVLTDSSGLYQDLRVLGDSHDRGSYLAEFKVRLRAVFEDYGDRYDRFVIHTPFKVRAELSTVEEVLDEQEGQNTGADAGPARFVVMKFNDRNPFFGYLSSTNSLIPYEGTVLPISGDEYLVWFEGLSRKQTNVRKQIQRPVHVEFRHPKRSLSDEMKMRYLQDAANLSGANWRGFNAKSLPVSVYYAQLISRFYGSFDEHGLDTDEIDLSEIAPWFL